MVSKPISWRPFIVGSESSSVEKGTRSAMPSCGTAVGAASSDPDMEFFSAEKRGFLGARIERDAALSGALK